MLGFHSIRADMSRRARCGIPQRLIPFQPCALGAKRLRWSPASAWDLYCFSQRTALSTGQYMRAVPKQRKPPQTANRLDGRHAPWLRLRGMCSFSLWTRHYRKYRLVNRQRLARVGGAPTETVNVRLSPFESVKAPHQTLMHTQSAFQYWGAQVIGHTFGCA